MGKHMNIIHFSTYDRGGAGEAAYRFHKILQMNGHQSLFFVIRKTLDDDTIIEIDNKFLSFFSTFVNKSEDMLNFFDSNYSFFDREREVINNFKDIIDKIDFKPDAIVLNWISYFIDLKVVKDLQDHYEIPVYWQLMDMGPFTGGCHYAWDCEGYKNSCEKCPAILINSRKKMAEKILKDKMDIISQMDVSLFSGSAWTINEARTSALFKKLKIYNLGISVDENTFRPLNKKQIRKKYNIPLDKKVIYFAASNIQEKRKGYFYLIEALKMLETKKELSDSVVLTAGQSEQADDLFKDLHVEHYHIGLLKGNHALAEGYNMADVFISPSIQDSGPMMVNESLMCGVPVIAFEMGVAVGLIENGVTGYKARLKDSKELSESILKLITLNDEDYQKMSKNCRELAEKTNSYENIMKTFENIIEQQELSL